MPTRRNDWVGREQLENSPVRGELATNSYELAARSMLSHTGLDQVSPHFQPRDRNEHGASSGRTTRESRSRFRDEHAANSRRTRSDLVALSPELLSGLWLTRGRFSRVKIRVRREFASSCRENRARTTPRKLRKSFVGGRMGSLAFLAEEWEWSPTMGWQRYGLRH